MANACFIQKMNLFRMEKVYGLPQKSYYLIYRVLSIEASYAKRDCSACLINLFVISPPTDPLSLELR